MVGSGWLKWLCFAVGWQFGGPGLAFMSFAAGYYLEKHWLPNGNPSDDQQGQDYRIALQEIAVLLHAAITQSAEIQQQQWRYVRQEFQTLWNTRRRCLISSCSTDQPNRIAHCSCSRYTGLSSGSKLKASSVFDVLQSAKIQPILTQAELQKTLLIGRGLGLSPEEAQKRISTKSTPIYLHKDISKFKS